MLQNKGDLSWLPKHQNQTLNRIKTNLDLHLAQNHNLISGKKTIKIWVRNVAISQRAHLHQLRQTEAKPTAVNQTVAASQDLHPAVQRDNLTAAHLVKQVVQVHEIQISN